MGQIRQPSPVLLFMAVFSSIDLAFPWARQRVEDFFGPVQLESEPFSFESFTSYYEMEMGSALPKRLWGFRDPVDPARLPEIKRKTNELEDEFRDIWQSEPENDRDPVLRPLNLDPGYVDLGKLILASTKDHAHRIYLSGGIFAETTLMYTQKRWKPLPWTYPDYQSETCHDFLDRCRNYLKQLR